MKNFSPLLVVIFFMILSCQEKASSLEDKIPNVQIYNSSTDSLTLQLNNTNIEIPASSTVYKYMENGTHEVICNDVKFTFDLAEKERVLINPFQDSVIMEEVLYVWTLTTFSVGHDVKNEDYT